MATRSTPERETLVMLTPYVDLILKSLSFLPVSEDLVITRRLTVMVVSSLSHTSLGMSITFPKSMVTTSTELCEVTTSTLSSLLMTVEARGTSTAPELPLRWILETTNLLVISLSISTRVFPKMAGFSTWKAMRTALSMPASSPSSCASSFFRSTLNMALMIMRTAMTPSTPRG